MPALSQSLTFQFEGQTATSITFPNTATNALIYYGDKIRGDGFYSNSDGFHTVQISLNDFAGIVKIQGTLASEPTDSDWSGVQLGTNDNYSVLGLNNLTVDTTGLIRFATSQSSYIEYTTPTSSITTFNFVGNYVWIRAVVSNWSAGTVHSIQLNR